MFSHVKFSNCNSILDYIQMVKLLSFQNPNIMAEWEKEQCSGEFKLSLSYKPGSSFMLFILTLVNSQLFSSNFNMFKFL